MNKNGCMAGLSPSICQVPLILEQIPENPAWEEGQVCPLGLSRWVLGLTVFRGLTSTCLPRPGRATPRHALRAHRSGGPVSAASASQRPLLKAAVGMCVGREEPRKCRRVNGVIKPQPSKLPPTQACQTLQEKSSRCVSSFTCLMAEERTRRGRLVGRCRSTGAFSISDQENPIWE